ncbi:replication protein [Rhodococcus hoagii]|nr:replication protein [Prescottella equi]NKT96337.1 replication protein [Prescottella equi]
MSEHTHVLGGIQRGPRRADHFTILSNAVLNDSRLSFRARGVLMWLLSKPADWRTRSESIAGQSPTEGRDAIRTAMRELESLGYLVRQKIQDDRGRWRTLQTIFEEPFDASAGPGPEKATHGQSDSGEPVATQRTESRRTETNHPTRPAAASPTQRAPHRTGVVVAAHAEGRLDALAEACRARGLTARWDAVKPEQCDAITGLLETHGVAALADAARDAHRPSNPTRYAQGFIGAWSALTTARRVMQGPPAPAELRRTCPDCVGGWVEDAAGLPIRRCACRTAAAA